LHYIIIVVWQDMIYTPSEGHHRHIEQAIDAGVLQVTIPDLALRPTRPLINVTSASLFTEYQNRSK